MENNTLILGAMRSETELLIASLENKKEYAVGPFAFSSGEIYGKSVIIGQCLVGTACSAAAAALGIESFSPARVLNCGTAGGHDPLLRRGDIVLGETVINAGRYNTPHKDAGQGSDSLQWSIPKSDCFEREGHTTYHVFHADRELLTLAEGVDNSVGRVISGTVLSSDAWNRELDRIEQLHRVYGSSCEDMESYSVAEICHMYSIPFLPVRMISNSELYPDEPFDLERPGYECQKFMLELLKII